MFCKIDAQENKQNFILNEKIFKKYLKFCNIYSNFLQMKVIKKAFTVKLKHSVLNQTTKS